MITQPVEYTHKFEDTKSSIIDAVFYNKNDKLLFVRLKSNGTVVGYRNVDEVAFEDFKRYPSRGTYWNSWIKGYYPGVDGNVTLKPADSLLRQQYENEEWQYPYSQTEETIKPNTEREFVVSVEVQGTLTFNVNNEDALGAAQYVKNLLSKSVTDGVAFIKEVKVVE